MNRTDKAHAILLYCAGECVPYSLLYCLPADVSRRQTVQTFDLYINVTYTYNFNSMRCFTTCYVILQMSTTVIVTRA